MIQQEYNGSLTSEKFLFYETRIAAKFYLDGKTIEEAIPIIKKDNLFQYPTEKKTSEQARASYRRLEALNNKKLVEGLAYADTGTAKQINLYAMMRYNRIVREFMTSVIGEKLRTQDFSFSRRDVNVFFTQLEEQSEKVASWSEETVKTIKRVLINSLVETGYLDSYNSETLNPVLLSEELEQGIRENNDLEALSAFNCFS